MNDESAGRRGRRGGGRAARQAARAARTEMGRQPFLTRSLPPHAVLGEEGLAHIEENAETILERVGVEIVDYPEALEIFRNGGADVDGTRVRFPRGLCRSLITEHAPARFTQLARNPERSVEVGDPHVVFAPVYGPPFVRTLDEGRRYATIEDFRNLVKLTYLSPNLHHSGGTVCEPVDLPVDQRHLDMVLAHMTLSDKAFMGSVTHPDRAADTVAMARLLFGDDTVETSTVVMSLINANSPLSWDFAMLGSARVYAEAGQACVISPFVLAGAMAPVTAAATATQILAEAMSGMAFCQMVRPGAPVVFGSFASSMSMQSGAPTFGTPEPALILFTLAALARRLGVPFRSGGNLTASKVPDAQAAYESAMTMYPALLAGTNFVLHAAGWLDGGLVAGYEKLVIDDDQLGAAAALLGGVDLSPNGLALDTILDTGPGQHFLGTQHTLDNFTTAFWTSQVADNESFEKWRDEGSVDAIGRANRIWKQRLRDYEQPPIDDGSAQGRDPGRPIMTSLDHLDAPARAAIRRVLEDPLFELIPLKNVLDQARHLPDGATVSVTASPAKGMEATLDLAADLQNMGFDVVPHLSARLTTDRSHLQRILDRLDGLEISRVFVVGGDAEEPGEFFDGLSLLQAMEDIGHRFTRIGIPGYPEGHAVIPDDSLTTQMCFSAAAIVDWLWRQRGRGIHLPVTLGMPGVADRLRLLKISARIGVGDSVRFLRKNLGLAGRFMLPGGYNPAELLEELGTALDDPDLNVAGVHIYTFNSCDTTEDWRLRYLEELG